MFLSPNLTLTNILLPFKQVVFDKSYETIQKTLMNVSIKSSQGRNVFILKKTCPIVLKIREIRPKLSRMQYMEWINVGKVGYLQGSKGRLFITNLLCLNLIMS